MIRDQRTDRRMYELQQQLVDLIEKQVQKNVEVGGAASNEERLEAMEERVRRLDAKVRDNVTRSITNLDEAAIPSFGAVCDEEVFR